MSRRLRCLARPMEGTAELVSALLPGLPVDRDNVVAGREGLRVEQQMVAVEPLTGQAHVAGGAVLPEAKAIASTSLCCT